MSREDRPVGIDDIHALVDGRLTPERRCLVEAHLETHPDDAARAEIYRRQNAEMRRLYDPVLTEPVPLRLLARRAERLAASGEAARFKPSPLRMLAGVVWLLVGVATGWVAHERLAPRHTAALRPPVVQEAVAAHLVYAPEIRHPVEVAADQSDHLFKWLSNRLGAPVRAPSLQAAGFHLVGGRLLPAARGPAALFLYENPSGDRLTLYVATAADNRDTAFRYAQAEGAAAVWWVDGPLAYALAGQADNQTLQRVAHLAHAGLTGG